MLLQIVRWIHLVAAATWLGGLITLAALVVALRKAGADREMLRAAARQFGRVSWTAMAIAVVTGFGQVLLMHLPWSNTRLHAKIGVVALAVAIAAFHQVTAKTSSPAARGMIQGLIFVVSLAIFGVAVWL